MKARLTSILDASMALAHTRTPSVVRQFAAGANIACDSSALDAKVGTHKRVAMASAQQEPEYGVWAVDEHPLRIEYSIPVLASICAEAVDGLYKFRHGGLEVGGVLFGRLSSEVVRIEAFRPIECEHAFGPRFVLSDRDRAALRDLIDSAREDPELRGLAAAGWYHSHTRSGIALSPLDMDIYDRHFPHRLQVALVVRPDQFGPARAGFFVREPDNSVETEASYQEFMILPQRGQRAAPERHIAPQSDPVVERESQRPAPEAPAPAFSAEFEAPSISPELGPMEEPDEAQVEETSAAAQSVSQPFEFAKPDGEPQPSPLPSFARAETAASRKWVWWAVAGLCVAALGIGVERYYALSGPQQPLSLWVADVGGQLMIEWDRTSRPVRSRIPPASWSLRSPAPAGPSTRRHRVGTLA